MESMSHFVSFITSTNSVEIVVEASQTNNIEGGTRKPVKSVYASRLILFVFGICRYLFQPDVAELEERGKGKGKDLRFRVI